MTINEQQTKDLYAFIDEIPTKYGIPLLKFFNEIEASEKEAQVAEVIEEENN